MALVQGYPAFDAPHVVYALKRQGVPVEVFDAARGWLRTGEYEKYGAVVIVGNLVRAKMEPNRYVKEDFPRVRKYLEQGGTLLLMRVGLDVFTSQEGRHFLAGLTEFELPASTAPMKVRLPDHACRPGDENVHGCSDVTTRDQATAACNCAVSKYS